MDLSAQHFNGVEIMAIEQGHGKHPNPSQNGRIVPLTGVKKLLLADETEIYVDEYPTCDKAWDNAHSVVAHMSAHTREPGPVTDVQVIKNVLRLMKTHTLAGTKNRAEIVAEELNRLGVKTHRGKPWTATGVSSLYNTYKDQYRVHVPRPRTLDQQRSQPQATISVDGSAVAVDATNTTPNDGAVPREDVMIVMGQLGVALSTLHNGISDVARAVQLMRGDFNRINGAYRMLLDYMEKLPEDAPKIDPEILEKARRFDEMSQMFRPPQ